MSIPQSTLTPLTLIGGSANTTAVKIDWISVTLPLNCTYALYPNLLTHNAVDAVPPRGYKLARRFTDGRLEAINPDRSDMGRHIVYSGGCLNDIERGCGLSGKDILAYYVQHDAKITRLDVAIDALNSGFSIQGCRDDLKADKARTNAKKHHMIEDENGGQTLYIGSRTSEAMMRIYDKAKESRVAGDWIRFELECKDSKAMQVAGMITRLDESLGALVQSLIKGFVDFPDNPIYQHIMHTTPTVIVRAKDKASDTFKWLMETCAPKLGEYAAMKGDPFIIDHFITLAMEAYQKVVDDMQKGEFADYEAAN